ncbi:hypothetical protein [Kutzneria sp. 744]|uniref:hypothetical protein n=1 Tax=Kutzneria sp. (strain 744) TaxID=345341 RepID=UPI0012F8C9E1|nr:hypothetical protein [Kutzneria sp. 744]
MADFERTPGVPGILGDLLWVSASEFSDDEGGYRPVDPAPLARLLYAAIRHRG